MNIVAYIDESGDENLNVGEGNVTKFFVVACVVIEPDSVEIADEVVNRTRKKYFSGSELKSNGITRNLKRRLDVLRSLSEIKYTTHIVAVDKSKISGNSGLIYKQPFLKFTNGLLYRKLFRNYDFVEAFCDKHGKPKWQESFINYLTEYHRQDLFKNSRVQMVDSKDCSGVQIADMVAGSVREILEYQQSQELYDLLKEKSALIEIWPPSRGYLFETSKADSKNNFDRHVERYCINQAEAFIERNINTDDEEVLLQVRAVECLLAHYYSEKSDSYVSTKEIIGAVVKDPNELKVQYFRTKIISELRDNDVIIAGSPIGLKIPTTVSDLKKYVDENGKRFMPMIDRLSRARNQILAATLKNVDIVDGNEEIKLMLDFLKNHKIMASFHGHAEN